MFRKSIAAAVLVAGAAFVPAAAQAATGFTVEPTELLAGPDYDYPTIRIIGDNRRVEIFGCLQDWSFCDVGYRYDRGWVNASDIVVDYHARRVSLIDAGPYVGIGFLSFSFGNYWDTYYRGRPFYRERGRWERHYHDHWRTSWGPRRDWNYRDRDRRDWNDRDRDRRDLGDRHRSDWNYRDRIERDRRDGGDRSDNDRRGIDRRDSDSRTSYRGAPNNPAITTPTPQPRPGLTERDDNRRRDNRRDVDRHDGNWFPGKERSSPQATIPTRPAPAPKATATPRVAPAMDNDRPNRGVGMDRGNRQALDRSGAGNRPDRPREASPQREDREPRRQKRSMDPDEQDNGPGR